MTLRTQIADAMKRPKADVDYSHGKPDAHCGICEWYERHTCEKVRGVINEDMWCRLWQKRQ